MIQHIRILSIFPFVQMSKIHTRAPDFEMNRPPKWCFITWRLVSYAKPELILWLWEKIRKSWCACLYIVMFCHGWQNKAASSHGWLVVAGHVTPRKSNSGIPRFFLFSYNGTKITPALRKMPLTSLRYTIWGDDLFHKQTSIYRKCHQPIKNRNPTSGIPAFRVTILNRYFFSMQ